jgi:predicted metal-binding protein
MKNKIVPFTNSKHLPPAVLQLLIQQGKKYGLESIYPFSPEEILVAEWVQLKCRYGCSRYNKSWCCPPATPGPEKVREILSEYSQALLLVSTRNSVPEFYLDNSRKRAKLIRCWKGTVSLERVLFLEGYYKAFSLVGESCALCKECSYPNDCLFPREKRPSLESFSIDVFGTLERMGISTEVKTNTKDSFSYYAIILVS